MTKSLPLICISFAVALSFAVRAPAQILIIANPSVKASETTKAELRDVFTGESKNLKDGSHVMPVLLENGATHEEFLNGYIHMPDSIVRTSWRKLTFSGQSTMPRFFDSEAALVAYVARTSGAIGYIGEGTAHDGVKVLAVK